MSMWVYVRQKQLKLLHDNDTGIILGKKTPIWRSRDISGWNITCCIVVIERLPWRRGLDEGLDTVGKKIILTPCLKKKWGCRIIRQKEYTLHVAWENGNKAEIKVRHEMLGSWDQSRAQNFTADKNEEWKNYMEQSTLGKYTYWKH